MDADKILNSMRVQAWERAKGELESIFAAFWGKDETETARSAEYGRLKDAFVEEIEEGGYLD